MTNYFNIDAISSSQIKTLKDSIFIKPREAGQAANLGTIVDDILTGNPHAHSTYTILDYVDISGSNRPQYRHFLHKYVKYLKNLPQEEAFNISVREVFKQKKDIEKAEEIIASNEDMVTAMLSDQMIISQDEYNKIQNCVTNLKNSTYTHKYFNADNIEYQKIIVLPIPTIIDGNVVELKGKCMIDMVVTVGKTVYIIDIKTITDYVSSFPRSAYVYRYDIQAQWYYMLAKRYYSGYNVTPLTFLVGSTEYDEESFAFRFQSLEKAMEDINKAIDRYAWHTLYNKWQYEKEVYLKGIRYI